ncbi:MAG: ABC transporter substrate-binding protein [Sulfuricella sp.]|nr:ABC transporter substrate-binding protein [Sulfuricella sp.]
MSLRSGKTFFLIMLLWVPLAQAEYLEDITLSAPGPRNISYLPIDLISKIGADREEGVQLRIIHTGGGAVALNNLITRNTDFAVAGVPAAMSLRANGGDVVVIAPVDDAPLFVLMVRAGLKGSVKRIADLKGKVVGVNTSTRNSKTTSQQLAELLLLSGGIASDQVRIVPAGQSWEARSALLITGTADAVMGDEPFASRLLKERKVFFLANLAEPQAVKNIKGSHFLHAALETRSDVIINHPQKVEKMARILHKTLKWIASHRPEEVVEKLEITDPDERDALLFSLKKYPAAFSKDGKFSTSQLEDTDLFFHAGNKQDIKASVLQIEHMVNDKWAGRKP